MIAAFDIGGSTIKSASGTGPDNISILSRKTTPLDDFLAFVSTIKAMITEMPHPPKGVAISVTGSIDPDTGLAKCANIPCIDQRVLKVDLEQALDLPVWLANDADCFALAEAHFGAGRGHNNVFGIILGTGVGGGLVLEGKLISGTGGFSGEWGHGPALPNTSVHWPDHIPHFACGCGQMGCVDTIGGARGLERLHHYFHNVDLPSTDIIRNWQSGEVKATTTVNTIVDLISGPLAMVLNVTGSSIVPVGGGLSSVHRLVAQLDQAVRGKLLRKSDDALIVPQQCNMKPGLIGAAMLGLQNLGKRAV